jgi:hypothetical protein
MANTWNYTASIAVGQMQRNKITRITELDEDAKRMVVEVQVIGGGGLIFPIGGGDVWRLEVLQTAVDGVAAHPAPSRSTDTMLGIRIGGLAGVFDTLLAAYRAAGADKRGNLLTAMAAVSGVVQGGPLDGQTKTMIPPGNLT